MLRILARTAVVLSIAIAAPALGDDAPMLLVVSDFDAALLKDAMTKSGQALAQRAARDETARERTASRSQRELKGILTVLRNKRTPHYPTQAAERFAPEVEEPRVTSSTDQTRRRSPNPV